MPRGKLFLLFPIQQGLQTIILVESPRTQAVVGSVQPNEDSFKVYRALPSIHPPLFLFDALENKTFIGARLCPTLNVFSHQTLLTFQHNVRKRF